MIIGLQLKLACVFAGTSDAAPTASSLIHEDATDTAAKATRTANGPLSATATSPSASATGTAQPNSAQMSFNYAVGSSIWNTLFPVIFGSVIREL